MKNVENEDGGFSTVTTSCILGPSTYDSYCRQQCHKATDCSIGPGQAFQRWYNN